MTAPFAGQFLSISAPSRQWVTDTGAIDWALHEKAYRAAEGLGFSLRLFPSTLAEVARFAGDDALRALDWVYAQEEGALYMALRGGYGASRLLAQLTDQDWERVAASRVPQVGYSDYTAINLAVLAKTGRETWQGPTLRDLIDIDPLTLTGLQHVLGLAPWRVRFTGEKSPQARTTTGTLWGGNLTVLLSLLGTPWWPQVDGGILFLEDIGETAYQIDRALSQLAYAGVLSRQRLVILGDFKGADRATKWDGDFSFECVKAHLTEMGIPFVTGLPFGHLHRKVSLPVGRVVTVTVDEAEKGATITMEDAK